MENSFSISESLNESFENSQQFDSCVIEKLIDNSPSEYYLRVSSSEQNDVNELIRWFKTLNELKKRS